MFTSSESVSNMSPRAMPRVKLPRLVYCMIAVVITLVFHAMAPPTMDFVPDFDAIFHRVYGNIGRSEVSAAAYAEMFRILLSCPEGAVYFHCAQGKDRTGIGAILILTALGADLETAKADYFLSNIGLKEAEAEPSSVGVRPWPREVLDKLFNVFQQTLNTWLEAVGETWGGLDAYLRGPIGLTDGDIALLRKYYLE